MVCIEKFLGVNRISLFFYLNFEESLYFKEPRRKIDVLSAKKLCGRSLGCQYGLDIQFGTKVGKGHRKGFSCLL